MRKGFAIIRIMGKRILVCLLFFFGLIFIKPIYSYADFSLSGSSSFTGTKNVAIPISDLQITGSGTEPVPVKLFTTNGTLSMSTTTGLTFDGSSSGSTIYFSGSLTNVNAALATLTYTRSTTGTDTLEVSLVPKGEVFFTGNNHLYKFITSSVIANTARSLAKIQTAYGVTGYLATITSQEENDFVAARLQGDGWMGASDATTEGDWKWLDGPEADTSFWSGAASGSVVSGGYANWSSGEPNNFNTGEDCAEFYMATGKWNDLPCTGNSLSGYVVEFGSPGNLPVVVAKNISMNVVENPTASTFTPADGATSVTTTANLSIVFSKVISKGTGSILIKKTIDDSVVESIDVTNAQVSGAGTTTITINPSITFAESTGYYVIVPATAFKDADNASYAGISTNTGWNFTTGDFTNPVITDVLSSAIGTTSGTITWKTNENASTKIRYGLTTTYGLTTSETDTSLRVATHSGTLNNLKTCSTYHYAVVSTDSSSNTATSSDNTLVTTGCAADSAPISATSSSLLVEQGGTISLTKDDAEIEVKTPTNFTDESESVVIQIQSLSNAGILSSLGKPAAAPREVGDIAFDVKAIINETTVLDSFDAPVTITYQYSDADIANLDESSLWLYHYHDGAWVALDSCTTDTSTNTISCTTQSFSLFALFGKGQAGTGSSGGGSSSSSDSSCNGAKPASSPDLFQIDVDDTHAVLYYSPLTENVTDYSISYSETPNTFQYGVSTGQGPSSGVLSFGINLLQPNTTYYFRIRGQNGCMPGDFSNELAITTRPAKTTKTVSYYRYFTNPETIAYKPTEKRVLGVTDKIGLSPTPALIRTPSATPVPQKSTQKKNCFFWWCF